jgi:hypothetical protein
MMTSQDATPAYRGYRLQALYTFFRILDSEDGAKAVFQPEIMEDLAVLDVSGNLLEVIQVKSNSKLTLSSFNPKSELSFFYRANAYLKTDSPPEIHIASFGEIGPSLLQAIENDGIEREREAEKLSSYGHVKKDDAKYILDNINIFQIDVSKLTESVYEHLRNALTGIDPDNAFDLLSYWLYICAENKYKITKNDIIKKVEDIGKFLAKRAAYHSEWFTSIIPIEDYDIEKEELRILSDEFYKGVSARYDHILADLDVFRLQKMLDIDSKFKDCRVVVIHGASGQGKSTLAYRYLHDSFPNMWRFKVELIENRKHALSIARALIGHADAIDIPIAIYLDISAKDNNWPELIRQLSVHRNIRILVTIREEDYNRASIPDYEIQFSDIDLTFDRSEAQAIYHHLAIKKTPTDFLSFEEAWDKFGGEGPLMEFVHLVTQGESLRKRLKQQVNRLKDEARSARGDMSFKEIELLRLVSIASAFDSQLKVKPLVDYLKLPVPQRTFELFEKEYLLRLNEDGSLVGGLHPIRSEILVDLITDRVLSPWSKSASICLPMIQETDFESFLLHAFSRRRVEIEPLLDALNSYQPDKWAAIGGITRAFLWLGIQEYVEVNRELIQEAFEKSGTGFIFLLDSDISDVVPDIMTSSLNTFIGLGIINKANRPQIESFRTRQTDKMQVFARAQTWLLKRTLCPEIPQLDADWSGMAETVFWLGHLNISWPLFDWLPDTELDRAIDELPLETLSDVMLGIHYGYGDKFAKWLESNRSRIINRFREETLTVKLQDYENKVCAHFIIDYEKLNNPTSGDLQNSSNYLHDEAIRRVKLLRKLLPDRETYACQGYGQQLWNETLPIDDTQKTGIPKSNLPPAWLTSINSTFRGLAEMPYRPKNWEEYAKSIFELRKCVLSSMKELESVLQTYFRKQKPDQWFSKLINSKEWIHNQQMLLKSPLIPSCAIDEWGFMDEFLSDQMTKNVLNTKDNLDVRGLALQKHKPFLNSFRKYDRSLSNFFNQSSHVMVLNSIRGKCVRGASEKARSEKKAISGGVKPEYIRSSTINLSDAVKVLPTFQRIFRYAFSQFFEIYDLYEVEKQEEDVFNRVFSLWYLFSIDPNLTHRKAEREFPKNVTSRTNAILKNIQKSFSDVSSADLSISIQSSRIYWDDVRALWISIDGKSAIDVYNSAENAFPLIFNSVRRLNDFDLTRLVFEFTWPSIVVVPKLQGKCLTDKAWRINSNILLLGGEVGKLSWWNFLILHQIPKDALAELNFDIWDDTHLEVVTKLLGNAFDMSFRLAHIRDLGKLSELDEQGINQFGTYAQNIMNKISIECTTLSDSSLKMMNVFKELPESEYEKHQDAIKSMQALIEMIKYIPGTNGEAIVDFKTIERWANMLEKAREYAAVAYLFWASDVISNM